MIAWMLALIIDAARCKIVSKMEMNVKNRTINNDGVVARLDGIPICGTHARDGVKNTTNSPNLSGEARP